MNCKICHKNEPKYFFRSLIANEAVDTFICEECFRKATQGGEALGVIGEDIIVNNEGTDNLRPTTQNVMELKCSHCETNLGEISKTGRFGCERCYDIFSDLIAIADAQIDTKEKSLKEDLGDKADESVEFGKIKALENKMQSAIKNEDYESAAKIRDEIKKLKEEVSENGKAC